MKVIHSPVNIGNQASVLSLAEKKLKGEFPVLDESLSVNFTPNFSCYPADQTYSSSRFFQRNILGKVINSIKIFLFGIFNLKSFDVYHFYFGRSFLSFGIRISKLNLFDLWLLKKLGKKIFFTYQGCDARQRTQYCDSPISACKLTECMNDWCRENTDAHRRANISKTLCYADKVFCLNPDLVPLVDGAEFLPYATLFPEDFFDSRTPKSKAGKKVTILHAPSDRAIKGTKYILHAIERLKKKYDLELVLLEGLSQEQVYAAYRDADILVDQVLVGWYGSTAVEGMASGCPVVSFINDEFLKYLLPGMGEELPIVSADPTNLYEKLEDLIKDSQKRLDLAEKGLRFVNRWHHPDKIARAMLELYQDPSQSFAKLYNPNGGKQ